MNRMNYSKIVTLIETEVCEGNGTERDPSRLVRYFHQQDGTQVFKIDPIEEGRMRSVADWAGQLARSYQMKDLDDEAKARLSADLIIKNT